MKKWLVVITFKKWIQPQVDSGVIEFYEVEANTEYAARVFAMDKFEVDYQYKPWVKKFMKQWNATLKDTCAPEAVEI